LRDGETQDVTVNIVPCEGPPLVNAIPIKLGGFGLVGMNKAAMLAVRESRPMFLDDDGVRRTLVFHDELDGEKWWGEDFSFFLQLPESVGRFALVVGVSNHSGIELELERVAELCSGSK